MTELTYSEKPEVLKEALSLFRKQMRNTEQFDGKFQNGKVDGVFFSSDFFDSRRMTSFLQISGSYHLDDGTLHLILKKSVAFWVSVSIWLSMALIAPIAIVFSTINNFAALFPFLMGTTVILIYFMIYRIRKREFLGILNHYMKCAKEKTTTTLVSKTQNTHPKPPHSISEEQNSPSI